MIRLFESPDSLHQAADDRVFGKYSSRTVFLWLLAVLFMLGAEAFAEAYGILRLHRFDWSFAFNFPVLGFFAVRCARVIYRGLPR